MDNLMLTLRSSAREVKKEASGCNRRQVACIKSGDRSPHSRDATPATIGFLLVLVLVLEMPGESEDEDENENEEDLALSLFSI